MNSNETGGMKVHTEILRVDSVEAEEIERAYPPAYGLAVIIAMRARCLEDTFSADGLKLGEALLGDCTKYDISQSQYRRAKRKLKSWGFATFKTTSRGTVARLTDARLFRFVVKTYLSKPAKQHLN